MKSGKFFYFIATLFVIGFFEFTSDYKMIKAIENMQYMISEFSDDTKTLTGPQRIFQVWDYSKNASPCISKDETSSSQDLSGLLYMKILKTASSTLAGVNTRIAYNLARKKYGNMEKCKSESSHEWFQGVDICKRDKSKSFLWTCLRHPTKRAISDYFHKQVSRKGIKPTDANFKYYVRRYRLDYLRLCKFLFSFF